jgi:pimeloyl-ACP methyl ester carboxylesterase
MATFPQPLYKVQQSCLAACRIRQERAALDARCKYQTRTRMSRWIAEAPWHMAERRNIPTLFVYGDYDCTTPSQMCGKHGPLGHLVS